MSERVRIGVVGTGSLALSAILPHLSQADVQDRIRVQALCDPVPGRAAAAAEKFGAARAFTSVEALLEEGDVDAVTIASPIGLHYRHGRMALEAGKHVHFNKTMTTTVAEATDLIERARARRLRMVVSPGQILHPRIQKIKQLITDGAIGALCWAMCGSAFGTYHQNEATRQGDDVLTNVNPSWYFRKPGGGPLYDMTVYGVHELTTVLGPARRVTGLSGVRIRERAYRGEMLPCDADDNTLMLLDFGDSLFAMVYGTAAGMVGAPMDHTASHYLGTRGSIAAASLNGEPFDYPGRRLVDAARAAGNRFYPYL